MQARRRICRTQPVFDLALLEQFLKRIGTCEDPGDLRHLAAHQLSQRRIHGERAARARAGLYMERMRQVDNAEKSREEGVAIAREMVQRVRGLVQGVQLSAPFGRYQMAIDVAEAIGAE